MNLQQKPWCLFLVAPIALLTACQTNQPQLQLLTPEGETLMSAQDFGLQTNQRCWDSTAIVVDVRADKVINESYTMLVGKRSQCQNTGVSRIYTLVNPQKDTLLVELCEMKDGKAFRYILPHANPDEVLQKDLSTYHIPADANRWMQRYTGPGYENFYPLCPGGISPEKEECVEWTVPALFELSGAQAEEKSYLLIAESDVLRDHCASGLKNSVEERNVYTVHLYDDASPLCDGWTSPWRVLIMGSLANVVESTLVNDLATPCQYDETAWIEPGVSSWIYWANNHGSQEYNILKEYVDLAVEMHWPYTLVDAEWDVMRGGNIEQLVQYAKEQGVKPMIWYNSTTNWCGEWAPTPQNRLNAPADREQEFATIAGWGVKGVKIDFFRDDNVSTNNYYIDLMEAAARHKMLVNFHGGTYNRGWQRTYPNLISTEAVYGAEWYNNRPDLTNKAACHNATLPFIRNVVGSMDYTPGTFTDSQHPHITTHGHELALTVLFESGIQHMPDRPSAYRELPAEVRDLLSQLPSAWDDTRFLAGYPGKSAVLARRKGNDWYIAGINGLDEPQELTLSTEQLALTEAGKKALLVADGETQLSFNIDPDFKLDKQVAIPCAARGGFVIKL